MWVIRLSHNDGVLYYTGGNPYWSADTADARRWDCRNCAQMEANAEDARINGHLEVRAVIIEVVEFAVE
jgi:hypothetical protein